MKDLTPCRKEQRYWNLSACKCGFLIYSVTDFCLRGWTPERLTVMQNVCEAEWNSLTGWNGTAASLFGVDSYNACSFLLGWGWGISCLRTDTLQVSACCLLTFCMLMWKKQPSKLMYSQRNVVWRRGQALGRISTGFPLFCCLSWSFVATFTHRIAKWVTAWSSAGSFR